MIARERSGNLAGDGFLRLCLAVVAREPNDFDFDRDPVLGFHTYKVQHASACVKGKVRKNLAPGIPSLKASPWGFRLPGDTRLAPGTTPGGRSFWEGKCEL